MSTLDQLKNDWNNENKTFRADGYTEDNLKHLFKSRVRKNTGRAMRYFWASFTLQIIVYAMLSHVIIRFWGNTDVTLAAFFGMIIYIPFTVVLMRKFKRLALTKVNKNDPNSIYEHVTMQRNHLSKFYSFKKIYEWFLIPVSCAIAIFIIFELYFPGGVMAFLTGAIITYILTLISCVAAIYSENKKAFIQPLQEFELILKDFRSE